MLDESPSQGDCAYPKGCVVGILLVTTILVRALVSVLETERESGVPLVLIDCLCLDIQAPLQL